ncbi:MAG: winged helix-turn-helix transcriptional regulator [Devosia sp.]|uniref:metalloregulator ArsR/SmtB family transcription factor n=1 Tax=Devosia sp. TaxID=1871048 RepID=UPI001AC9382C|nr:metalloregulator ArsR/SmtB family transcription factor [Devosia sp.]MBN9308582.1 winged helix-turn-helix transcriptional regulator [Devosia sp.]MBN9317791.1 winged helix-turn-helix transcriptional regulator [Devosia sp.]
MGINAVFEALSHPVRREILHLLRSGPMSAGALAGHFALSKPTLSVHFAKLRDAELVVVERQGTSLIYHLNTSILEEAVSGLLSLKEAK